MLLSDVGVNLLVVPAGIFFLSFPKWYVVGDTADSSVRLGDNFLATSIGTPTGLDAMLPAQ